MSKKCLSTIVMIVVLFFTGNILTAQTITGTIKGVVKDGSGNILPGATVTVEGPALMGSVSKQTDQNGAYWFPGLAPDSNYKITVDLDGYATTIRKEIVVSIAFTTAIDFVLFEESGETVQVTASSPMVQSDSSSSQTNYSEEFIEDIPIARGYQSAFALAPGVTGSGNVNVQGSGITDNVYLIDGVDTTDPLTATFGMNYNFDIVKEVQISTAGYMPEYGRATGGIFNSVTKSGSNEFHGEAFGYFERDNWQARAKNDTGTVRNSQQEDYGFMFGGPILKDKIWFFVNANPVNSTYDITNQSGSDVAYEWNSLFHMMKLSFQPSPRHALHYQYTADPTEVDYIDASNTYLTDDAYSYREQNSQFHSLRWNWIISDSLQLETQFARSHQILDHLPQNGDYDSASHYNLDDGLTTEGSGHFEFSDRYLTQFGSSLGWFKNKHEFKVGIDCQKKEYDDISGYTGGIEYIDSDFGVFPDPFYYRTKYPTTDISAKGDIYTLFLQDKFSVTDKFNLNFGFRWENMTFQNNTGSVKIEFEHMIAPRFGFAYDLKGNGRCRLYGNVGRFYDANALTLADMFSQTEPSEMEVYGPLFTLFGYPADLDGDGTAEDWEHWTYIGSDIKISDGKYMPPGIEPMYKDEFVLGYEQEIRNDMSIGIKYTYSEVENVIEDITDPTDTSVYIVGNPKYATRKYRGVELTFNKRLVYHWQFNGSYTWSRAFGNYWGGSQPGGGIYEGATVAFDFPELIENSYGRLPQDISHYFKFQGSYRFNSGFTIGTRSLLRSGYSYSKMDFFDIYGDYYIFHEKRGSYTLPWVYQVDLSLHYDLDLSKLGLPAKVGKVRLMADVFNVTNAQEIISVDTRWMSDVTDPKSDNPDWNQADNYQAPRTFRAGIKWIW